MKTGARGIWKHFGEEHFRFVVYFGSLESFVGFPFGLPFLFNFEWIVSIHMLVIISYYDIITGNMARNYLLSQHFLRNPRLALILIGHSNLKKRDLVVEIGAGSGVITSALLRRVAKVIAVEPDGEAVAKLRKHLEKQRRENVEVVEQDFMDYELPKEPYKVFANPPFHLSSAILHKLIESENPPEAIYLILQKQFALKLLNNERHYTSQLGLLLTRDYQTRIRLPLKPTDFTPPPAVPTVLFEAKRINRNAI